MVSCVRHLIFMGFSLWQVLAGIQQFPVSVDFSSGIILLNIFYFGLIKFLHV